MTLKGELCSKYYPVKHRLRLFEATVTAVLLYGSATWTMNADLERKLRSTQRKMLRWIIGGGRRVTVVRHAGEVSDSSSNSDSQSESEAPKSEDGEAMESWVDWLRRSNAIARHLLEVSNIEDWVSAQRRRKIRWAGHVARRNDGRWSHAVLGWTPKDGFRNVGRPRKRWCDDIDDFFLKEVGSEKGAWVTLAQCRDTWKSYEGSFCC